MRVSTVWESMTILWKESLESRTRCAEKGEYYLSRMLVLVQQLGTSLEESIWADTIQGEVIDRSEARIEKRDKLREKERSDEMSVFLFIEIRRVIL